MRVVSGYVFRLRLALILVLYANPFLVVAGPISRSDDGSAALAVIELEPILERSASPDVIMSMSGDDIHDATSSVGDPPAPTTRQAVLFSETQFPSSPPADGIGGNPGDGAHAGIVPSVLPDSKYRLAQRTRAT